MQVYQCGGNGACKKVRLNGSNNYAAGIETYS